MQKNMADIKKQSKVKGPIGIGFDLEDVYKLIDEETKNLRKPIHLEPLETWPHGMPFKYGIFRGKKTRFTRVLGSAGPTDIPEQKLQVISDPYNSDLRKFFSQCMLTDPVVAPAGERRSQSLFEDGFDIRFKLASQFDPVSGQQLTPDIVQQKLVAEMANYQKFLMLLSTWKDDNNILQLARDLDGVSFSQGKAAALISPGITQLENGKLPFLVEIITADDLAEPIIDIGLTRKLVAVKLNLEDKKIARADELVYITRGMRGLRREAKFYGTSGLETLYFISRIIKRIYNFDFSEAATAAYITKILFYLKSEGVDSEQQDKIRTFLQEFFKAGKLAFAMSDDVDHVDQVPIKVDWPMLDGVESKLADAALAQVGIPKSMMNREHNLNRDIATIQAIQFVRFVRKPAEKLVGEALENQLFNPLLSYLAGKPLSEIPVRIEIVRKPPQEGDIDVIYDGLAAKKNQEIQNGSMVQPDAKSPFGAAGLQEKITGMDNKLDKIQEQVSYQNFILKQKKVDLMDEAKDAIAKLAKQS